MTVFKCTSLALMLACCNLAVGQQQQTDQTRRSDRVDDRRDQISENRDDRQELRDTRQEDRQENRDARQAERQREGRPLIEGVADRIGSAIDNNMGRSMDEFIATCLLIGNQEEVALAQEAMSRAQNENVKQFAQMLISDHQKTIQELQQHARKGMGLDAGVDVAVSSDSRDTHVAVNQPQDHQIVTSESPTAQEHTVSRVDIDRDPMMFSGALDKVLMMQQQAAQECLSMTKAIMDEKQGIEFDKAFAGSQIGAHVGMLAKLKASRSQASPELASIIQESEESVKQHLEQAKQLCQELEGMQASNNR